jgi:hypothetical protein
LSLRRRRNAAQAPDRRQSDEAFQHESAAEAEPSRLRSIREVMADDKRPECCTGNVQPA